MKPEVAGAGLGWARLLAGGEPFRLLFPLGMVLGLVGVLLWPAWHFGGWGVYPGEAHARIMVQGFLSAFVIGFLGTAVPRLLEVRRVGAMEAAAYAAGLVVATGLHAAGKTMGGDQVFFLTMLLFCGHLLVRGWFLRRDVPPPGFVLVALGLGCAIVGAGVLVLARAVPGALPEWMPGVARLLLYQGYVMLPVMGVGAFLLPRFFGLTGRQSFPESADPPPGWWGRAGFALICGGTVLAGLVLEAGGKVAGGNGLKAVGVLVYILREVPLYRAGRGGGSLAFGLVVALLCLPLAYGLMAWWPERAGSFLHVLMIGGFSQLTLIVASRVLLGHGGGSHLFRAGLPGVRIMTGLVLLAMLTRVSADWMPQIRLSHYAYAAIAWSAGVVVWAVVMLPWVARGDDEG